VPHLPDREPEALTAGDPDRRDVQQLTQARDEAAFRALYARHTPALWALACRLLGGEGADVEDVVQETWMRAVRALGGFTWQSALRTWLSSILVNCCRERWRVLGVSLLVEPGEAALDGPDPHLWIDLERALASLPAGYRSVLVLHDVEGYTHEEIAQRLGVEPGTSKSQLARARRAMRSLLGAGRIPHTA
jgi:RNA polymerase sigma-70 factor (ECF subfamily)